MSSLPEHTCKRTNDLISSIEVTVLSALFDSAPDVAFFVKDVEGRYVAVNESLANRHGFESKSDVIGKHIRDICSGELGEIPYDQDDQVLKTGRRLVDHLEMHWNRPHEPVWCLTTKLPLHDAAGKITGLVGFSRDIRIPLKTDEIPEAFADALKQFEQTLSENVTPSWLAQQSNLTPQALTRFTNRVFGLTPTLMIARIRIEAASRMLRETNRSVADVALACGFCDHSAFTRAFRRATEMTPSDFRRAD